MTKYEPGVWYGWNGGEIPVHPKTKVASATSKGISPAMPAGNLEWSGSSENRVVAFYIIQVYREPREWWIHPQGLIHSRSSTPREGWVHVREVIDGEDAS